MSGSFRLLSLIASLLAAFALGMFAREAFPTQAAMMQSKPQVIHAATLLNGTLPQIVPGVWGKALAEIASADASAVQISTIALHTHSVPNEFLYVVGGNAKARVGSMSTVVKTGDFIFIPHGVAHSFQSIGAPIKLIAFETPKMPNGDIHFVK